MKPWLSRLIAKPAAQIHTYRFRPNSNAYDFGLREFSFNESAELGWSMRHGAVATIEMDVLVVGERFKEFKDTLKRAYMALPFDGKKFWCETIQHPDGMRDRIHMRIDKPYRIIGMLKDAVLEDGTKVADRSDVNWVVYSWAHGIDQSHILQR